ncbi:ATP-binding protein [Acetobacterium sp.]|uniref:ATP-binding protein n=1 Tax=Acetobacterium sp. TaxID=1872094 RepID=UPI00359350F1
MIETIAKLAQVAPTFSAMATGSTIHHYFEQNKEAEGVVIVNGKEPAGILMRNDFYQKIGSQFGYALYMNREVTLLMKPDLTCVDKGCDMAKLGFIAMSRNQDSIYDFIVILENKNYAGVVNIREFLIEMSKTKEREIKLLNAQQRILKETNEAEKRHRLEIEQKNAAIKNLLDHAGQGFLFFGSDLIISEEYSRECDSIFGFSIGQQPFLAVLKRFVDTDCLGMMQNIFDTVFNDANQTQNRVYLSILPTELKIHERYIQTEYKIIPHQTGKSIMMILTDVTQKKALALKNAEEKDNIKLIVRAISSKSEITQSIAELQGFIDKDVIPLLDNNQSPQLILQYLFRMVHTMKGDFSLNALHHTAQALHRLEDSLSAMQKRIETISSDEIRAFIGQIDGDQLLEKDIGIISEALGAGYFENEDRVTVSRQRMAAIENKIAAVFKSEEQAVILKLFDSLFYLNVKDMITDYNEYVQTLADRFGKNIGAIIVTGDDIFINRDRYAPFIKSLVHVFRNITDHGIEDPDQRDCRGKPEYGEITCALKNEGDQFVICLADDGSGIDLDIIGKKAVEKQIYSAAEFSQLSRAQMLATILRDDFSTRDSVDLYSGRGVGLAAVAAEIAKIGGKITIDSERGQYTRFTFVVPFD